VVTDMQSTDANKALVRRAIAYNHGAVDRPDEIFAPDFVTHMPGQPPLDRAAFEQSLAAFGEGFPGYTYELHDQIASGTLVANRITWHGVHGGEFAGIPATHKPFALGGINMFRVRDGRVEEQWAQLDFFGLLQQIGAIPLQ
jgi:steroid delta-isomerase-like uncharacterized protein